MEFFRLIKSLLGTATGKIAGIGLTLSVIVSIFKQTPQEWTTNLGAWAQLIRGIDVNILWGFFVVVLLFSFFHLYSQNQTLPSRGKSTVTTQDGFEHLAAVQIVSYDRDDFGTILRRLIDEGADEIRVFSYTAETLRDYISYSDRYKNLTIRILVRDWNTERREERYFNSELERRNPGVRPWKKWRKLRRLAKEFQDEMQSDLDYKIQVRFYRSDPLFKGMIVSNTKTKSMEAFFGLYNWIEWPEKGGSRFKGEGTAVIRLRSGQGEHEQILLERFASQFDRIWLTESLTFDDVLKADEYSDTLPEDE